MRKSRDLYDGERKGAFELRRSHARFISVSKHVTQAVAASLFQFPIPYSSSLLFHYKTYSAIESNSIVS